MGASDKSDRATHGRNPQAVSAVPVGIPSAVNAAAERVARAIEGPYLPVPASSRFTLEHLRDVRWTRLSRHEQSERLAQARAAIVALQSATNAADAERAADNWLHGYAHERLGE